MRRDLALQARDGKWKADRRFVYSENPVARAVTITAVRTASPGQEQRRTSGLFHPSWECTATPSASLVKYSLGLPYADAMAAPAKRGRKPLLHALKEIDP